MPTSANVNRLWAVLIWFFVLPVFAIAAETKQGAVNSEVQELRVDVPVRADDNNAIQQQLKSQLLSEKLIKMGRARSQGCTRCHGRTGMYSMAQAAGWEYSVTEFVVKELTAFRDGLRSHIVMSSVAKPLSDQDIALIAAWYQSVSPVTGD